jgi:hypothetical protein
MNETIPTAQPSAAERVAHALGWIVLGAAVERTAALAVPIITLLNTVPSAGRALALLALPACALSFAGGWGLVRTRPYGFWGVYGATLVSLYGMQMPYASGFSLAPLLDRLLPAGPFRGYWIWSLNLPLLALLVWAHVRLRQERQAPSGPRWLRAVGVAVLVGLALGGAWRQRYTSLHGSYARLAEIPHAGAVLTGLEGTGPFEAEGIYLYSLRSATLVAAGRARQPDIEAFANARGLNRMPERPEAAGKFLPQSRQWRLGEPRFPRDFGTNAVRYVGRVGPTRKAVLQLCWRPADERFALELMGRVD